MPIQLIDGIPTIAYDNAEDKLNIKNYVHTGSLWVPAKAAADGKLQTELSNVEGTPGSAVPSKAIQIGAFDENNLQLVQAAKPGGGDASSGSLAAVQHVVNVSASTFQSVYRASNMGDNMGDHFGCSGPMGFNGTNWDRWRNNVAGTLLASAARTEVTISPAQVNHNARGVAIYISVTAWGGSGYLRPRLRSQNFDLWIVTTVINGVGQYGYLFYPGASQAAITFLESKQIALPRNWDLYIEVGNAASHTYEVTYSYII